MGGVFMGKIVHLSKGENKMVTIYDVANYFIKKSNDDDENSMTPLKLQKLCYYAQAWSLVWDNKELFNEDFEAWVHGPANHNLFNKYRSSARNEVINTVDEDFNENIFNCEQRETLDVIWKEYGKYTGTYLEQLTHQEKPWKKTRGDLQPGMSCSKVIPKELIREFYQTLNA